MTLSRPLRVRRVPRRRSVLAVLLLVPLLIGCVASESQQPRDGRAGLQLTGSLAGRQIAVSDGSPAFVVDDCDPAEGSDDDVCALARDIDGQLFVLVFENPEALQAGVSLPVSADCADVAACDAVRDAAVVRVQVADARRVAATGGEVRVSAAEPGRRRYAGELRLELPGGTLSGSFDLVPRPEPAA